MGKILIVLGVALLLVGCADIPTGVTHNVDPSMIGTYIPYENVSFTGHTYGFWGGLWHGLIITFSWIGSWFNDSIALYAVNNNGGWYDFGFWLGIALGVGSGGSTAFATKRK